MLRTRQNRSVLANQLQTRIAKQSLKPLGGGAQLRPCAVDPGPVGKRGRTDEKRGARNRPGAQACPQVARQIATGNREAETQAGETEKLAEGPQYNDGSTTRRSRTRFRLEVPPP